MHRPLVEDETAVWRFCGEDGLRRLAADALIEVDDRPAFRARIVRVALAGAVCVDDMSVTPVRSVQLRPGTAEEHEMVAIHLVVEGRYRAIGVDRTIPLGPGEAVVVSARRSVRFEGDGPVRLLRVTTRLDQLPPYVRDGPPLPFGRLGRTVLLDGYREFLRSVLDEWSGDGRQVPHLVHALRDLTTGVLAEASEAQEQAGGAESTRFRIKDLIERRLTDHALRAVTIAAELGVSVRHVHQVFEPEGVTISRYIEERRLRATAADLRTRTSPARSIELAPRYGFGGADQLSRAFRRRYGVTLEEYRENSHLYRL